MADNVDWLKLLGGAGTGALGGALGIGIPKGIIQILFGAGRTVQGLAGLADLGIGIAAARQIPKAKDDFYKGALVGLTLWEIVTGGAQLYWGIKGVLESGEVGYSLGGGKVRGTYRITKK